MNPELIIKGFLAGLMVSVPMGPIGVLCIQRTINKGRNSGMVSGLGATMADTLFAVIAGLGITFIIRFIEEQQLYLQLAGGAVVLLLGVYLIYSNPIAQVRAARRGKTRLRRDFISVFFLTLTNPLTVFFFIAFFAGINLTGGSLEVFHIGEVVLGVLLGSATWWFSLTGTVNLFRHRFRLRNIWWMNKVTGVVLVVLGAAVIVGVLAL